MAYDVQKLIDAAKPHGLELAEDAAKKLVEVVFDWVAESAAQSENKFDDVIAPLIPVLKPVIMEQLDKIDGSQEG